MNYLRSLETQVETLAQKLGTNPRDVVTKLDKYLEQVEQLKQEVNSLNKKLLSGVSDGSAEETQEINGVKVMTLQAEVSDKKMVREATAPKKSSTAPLLFFLCRWQRDRFSSLVGVFSR